MTKPEIAERKLPWSPWMSVIFVAVLFFAAQFLAGVLISIYPLVRHWPAAQTTSWLNNSVAGQFIYVLVAESLTLAGIFWFLKRHKLKLSVIAFKRPRWIDPLYGLAAAPVYYLGYFVLIAVAGVLVPSLNVNEKQQLGFQAAHGGGALTLTFISLVVLPPLVEEILMRGFLYGSLRQHMPKITAALATSVLFASPHLLEGGSGGLLWVAFLDTFTLSLVLVYLRERTGSLWASITLHGLKNLVAFLALFVFHAG